MIRLSNVRSQDDRSVPIGREAISTAAQDVESNGCEAAAGDIGRSINLHHLETLFAVSQNFRGFRKGGADGRPCTSIRFKCRDHH
jgi:hypothetical protein